MLRLHYSSSMKFVKKPLIPGNNETKDGDKLRLKFMVLINIFVYRYHKSGVAPGQR